jgi:hypothetical protein
MTQPDTVVARVAARVLRAMAYDRNGFKDKLEEHIGGAYLEFYKARLATKNKQTEWVQHWNTEVRQLLDRNLVGAMLHSIRGFTDRRKAYEQVRTMLRARDAGYRRAAETIVLKDYGLRKVRIPLDDQDMEDFWILVDEAAENGLTADPDAEVKPQGKRQKGKPNKRKRALATP